MRSWIRVCVACSLFGCGPKQEAKAPPPKPVEAVAPVVVAEEKPDLSPVARPPEIVVDGRIKKPRAFVDTLTKWSSLPVGLEDLIPAEARPLARAIEWDAPIEVLVSLDPSGEGRVPPPLVIGSVGLKSLDEALSAADAQQIPTQKLAPGVFRVGELTNASCSVAVSLGSAPARLVCGRTTKDVDALLPYATRGLHAEPKSGADLELLVDVKPIHARYSSNVSALRLLAGVGQRQLALDSPRFDGALQQAVSGGIEEVVGLFNDLDQLKLEARLDATRNVLLGATELKLRGDSSWVAGTLAAMKPVPLPATLPRLPPAATLASYNTALPAERYTAMARIAADLVEGYLEHEKLPKTTQKRARKVLDAWVAKLPESFGFAMSYGQQDSVGYRHADTLVTRVSEPVPRIRGLYEDLFALLGDPALKKWTKKELKIDEKLWPKTSKKPYKLPGFKAPGTLFELTVDTKAWAAANEKVFKAIENMLPPADANEISRLDILVQPDGDATYVLTGDDPKEMVRVMAEHRKTEPGARLATPAHSDRIIAAGYFTLAYVARVLERTAKQPEVGKAVANAPSHGTSPITFSTTAGPGLARFDLEIPAAVFTDAAVAAVGAGPALKDAIRRRSAR